MANLRTRINRAPRKRQWHQDRYLRIEIIKALRNLTNWQLSQWARAGRPMDLEKIRSFARMTKISRSVAAT